LEPKESLLTSWTRSLRTANLKTLFWI